MIFIYESTRLKKSKICNQIDQFALIIHLFEQNKWREQIKQMS
jgi:hypothetical protein